MKAVARVLVLALLIPGCHSKRARYAAGGASIALGIAAFAIAPPKETCVYGEDLFDFSGEICDIGQVFRATFLAFGFLLTTTGVLTVAVTASRSEGGSTTNRVSERMTAQAVMAARAGDCDRARRLIDRIDPAYRATVLEDAAITRCLQ